MALLDRKVALVKVAVTLVNHASDLAQYYADRFRNEAKTAFNAWMATRPFENPDAPPHPFVTNLYQPRLLTEAAASGRRESAIMAAGGRSRTQRTQLRPHHRPVHLGFVLRWDRLEVRRPLDTPRCPCPWPDGVHFCRHTPVAAPNAPMAFKPSQPKSSATTA